MSREWSRKYFCASANVDWKTMSIAGWVLWISATVAWSFVAESSQINMGFDETWFGFGTVGFPELCNGTVEFELLSNGTVGVGNEKKILGGNGGNDGSFEFRGLSTVGYGHDEGDCSLSLVT
jgi:hypothetical protein